jgi:hypothetical protein
VTGRWPRELDLGAQIPQVSMPEVCEQQIRQLRSDLPQQLQVTADAAALRDGERVLDHDGMNVIELESVFGFRQPQILSREYSPQRLTAWLGT